MFSKITACDMPEKEYSDDEMKAFQHATDEINTSLAQELHQEAENDQKVREANFKISCKGMGINWSRM